MERRSTSTFSTTSSISSRGSGSDSQAGSISRSSISSVASNSNLSVTPSSSRETRRGTTHKKSVISTVSTTPKAESPTAKTFEVC